MTVPAHPKLVLRYRSGYTATASAVATPRPLYPAEVGIDATINMAAGAKNELRISLALAPETVTRTPDGMLVLDAAFTQTGVSGKELAKVEETERVASPETQSEMVRYSRVLKFIKRAPLLHVTIRDRATNRAGSIAIPLGKQ